MAFTLQIPGEAPLDLVVRIYPGNDGARKAEWEFNVMQRLGSVGYPVPKVYAYEAGVETLGSPFLIMERITGGTLWDVFFSAPRERYGEVLALNSRLMANLHDIPVNKVIPGVYLVKTRRRVLGRIGEEEKELEEHGLEAAFEPLVGWLKCNAERIYRESTLPHPPRLSSPKHTATTRQLASRHRLGGLHGGGLPRGPLLDGSPGRDLHRRSAPTGGLRLLRGILDQGDFWICPTSRSSPVSAGWRMWQ